MTTDTDTLVALAAQITPGPWELCAHLRLPDENGCTCGYRGVVFGRGDYAICQPGHDVTPGEEALDPPRLPRAEEIVNMRGIALLPELMAEAIANRARIEALEAEVGQLQASHQDAIQQYARVLDERDEARAQLTEARAGEEELATSLRQHDFVIDGASDDDCVPEIALGIILASSRQVAKHARAALASHDKRKEGR